MQYETTVTYIYINFWWLQLFPHYSNSLQMETICWKSVCAERKKKKKQQPFDSFERALKKWEQLKKCFLLKLFQQFNKLTSTTSFIMNKIYCEWFPNVSGTLAQV